MNLVFSLNVLEPLCHAQCHGSVEFSPQTRLNPQPQDSVNRQTNSEI